jgi:hypothetical protein
MACEGREGRRQRRRLGDGRVGDDVVLRSGAHVGLGRDVALLAGEHPHRLVDQIVDAPVEVLGHPLEALPQTSRQ